MERKDEGDCRNMAVPENSGQGRVEKWKKWRDVLEDDLKKGRLNRERSSDGQRQMEGSDYWENVRPVRARTRDKMRKCGTCSA